MDMRKLLRDEGGQAIVEYVLALSVAISIVSIIATGFRKSLFKLWGFMTREIVAGCPGCKPPDEVANRFR